MPGYNTAFRTLAIVIRQISDDMVKVVAYGEGGIVDAIARVPAAKLLIAGGSFDSGRAPKDSPRTRS
jgi:hypothetical protein